MAYYACNGIGANYLELQPGTNLNEVYAFGSYYGFPREIINLPNDINVRRWFGLDVIRTAAAGKIQILYEINGGNSFFIRSFAGTTWNPWAKILTSSDRVLYEAQGKALSDRIEEVKSHIASQMYVMETILTGNTINANGSLQFSIPNFFKSYISDFSKVRIMDVRISLGKIGGPSVYPLPYIVNGVVKTYINGMVVYTPSTDSLVFTIKNDDSAWTDYEARIIVSFKLV